MRTGSYECDDDNDYNDRPHYGIDLRAAEGTTIYAIKGGKIAFVQFGNGWGGGHLAQAVWFPDLEGYRGVH